jgi:pimeloyl-ACP methyl ester carboxylesterase
MQEEATTSLPDLIALNYNFWFKRGRHVTAINPETERLIIKMLEDNLSLEVQEIEEINVIDNSLKQLAKIYQRLLIINGEKDVLDFLEIGALIHKKVQQSQRKIIPNTAHLPNLENHDLVGQYIVKFLDETHYT